VVLVEKWPDALVVEDMGTGAEVSDALAHYHIRNEEGLADCHREETDAAVGDTGLLAAGGRRL